MNQQTKLTKMFQSLVIYLYGLFKILRRHGRSQFTWFEKQPMMRKRRNKRRAAAFVSVLIATRPERRFWMCATSQDWWDIIIIGTYTDEQWLANFCIAMLYIWFSMWETETANTCTHKRCTHLQAAIELESGLQWQFGTLHRVQTSKHCSSCLVLAKHQCCVGGLPCYMHNPAPIY